MANEEKGIWWSQRQQAVTLKKVNFDELGAVNGEEGGRKLSCAGLLRNRRPKMGHWKKERKRRDEFRKGLSYDSPPIKALNVPVIFSL
jgi:hypothetical protein